MSAEYSWKTVYSWVGLRPSNPSQVESLGIKKTASLPEPDDDHDPALRKWSNWIKTRRQLFERLANCTKRTTECLATNVDKLKDRVLDTTLLEEAEKYVFCDKYRGHPKWHTTVEPRKKNQKEKISHLMYPTNFKFDNEPDILRNRGYFGVPKAISEEQNIKGECDEYVRRANWNDPHLARRKLRLSESMRILEDFRPNIDELYVKGTKILPEPPPPVDLNLPEIVVSGEKETKPLSDITLLTSLLAIEKPSLLIHNVPTGPAFPETDEFEWIITFPMTDLNQVETFIVNFQNIGPTAVRYTWKPENDYVNPNFPTRDYKLRAARFLFNQGKGVLLPGQQMDLEFTFASPSNGCFREVWRFAVEPKVRAMPIIFVLQGISTEMEPKGAPNWTRIESHIQKLVADSCIKDILEKIERGVFVPSLHAPYVDMFGENEIFEFNNPKLYYRTREVTEMKEIYSQVSTDRWNFSTLKLRNTIIEAGLSCEDTVKYMDQMNHLVAELMHPPKEEKMEKMKYTMVYTMLCGFFNQMGTVADRLLTKMSCQRLPNIDTKYPPLQFDDPFERWMIEHVRVEPTATMSEKDFKKQQAKEAKKSKDGASGGGRKSKTARKSTGGRKSAAGKRKSASGQRKSATAKRKSAGGNRKSGAGQRKSTGGQRKSATGKRKSTGGGGRKSSAGARKSMTGKGKGSKGGSKKSKGSAQDVYIYLTDPPSVKVDKLEFLKEVERDLYRSMLEAYVRDLLRLTIDKVCSTIDTINTVEAGKEFDKDVDPVAYKQHYQRPVYIPALPSLF